MRQLIEKEQPEPDPGRHGVWLRGHWPGRTRALPTRRESNTTRKDKKFDPIFICDRETGGNQQAVGPCQQAPVDQSWGGLGNMTAILRAIWSYRGFIAGSVKREFQARYLNSLLGSAWTIINPLAMILIYTVVFSQVMRARLPGVTDSFGYSIYLCAGILTWGLFSEIATRSQTIFIDNANLLKKISFPRLCLPTTVICTALLNFAIIFGLFVLFLLATGNFPGWVILQMVPALLILVMFATGLGITLGVLNVFFRDVGQFFTIFVTFWFWLTPIVYPRSIVPEALQILLSLNPMSQMMAAFQSILVYAKTPDWVSLWPITLLGLLLSLNGLRLFRNHAGELVDEL